MPRTKNSSSNRGDGGKAVKEDLNVYAANCRSVVNKKKSMEEIIVVRDIDIGIYVNLIQKSPLKIRVTRSLRMFHPPNKCDFTIYVSM